MPIVEKPTKDNTLRVNDAQRAAVLLTLGCSLLDCPTSETGARIYFLFDDTDQKAREAGAAIAQDRPLPIATYLNNLRRCTELIYQFNLIQRQSNPRKRPPL